MLPDDQESKARNAIVIVSIGDRSWLGSVTSIAQRYAERCQADLIVEREAPSFSEFPLADLPQTPGRPNKRAYACKTYFAWKHLAMSGYDKVLVIDDTCCINSITPDVFDLVALDEVGYTTTGSANAQRSFFDIRQFQRERGIEPIEEDEDLYMNSGVLVYGRSVVDALSPEKVENAQDLLFSPFPHQSLTYFLLRSAGVRMNKLSKKYNIVPAVNLDKNIRRDLTSIAEYMRDDTYIYHITGMYRRRDLLIPEVCEILEKRWNALA